MKVRLAARKGFTLIEVVVSMLLSAVMISAVFSVALSSKQTSARSDRRLAAAQAAQSMMQRLKNYVTSDPASIAILGPTPRPGAASWYLNNPPSVVDSLGDVYALQPGTHIITGTATDVIPTALAAYGGKVTYVVAAAPNSQLTITVSASWNEP